MFEEQPQTELDALFQANPTFRQLYHRHKELAEGSTRTSAPADGRLRWTMSARSSAIPLAQMYDTLQH